jgi:hypothetical protein
MSSISSISGTIIAGVTMKKNNKKINQALQFIQTNLAFFAAPLLESQAFNAWGGKTPALWALAGDLRFELYGDTYLAFCDALLGKALDSNDRKNALFAGQTKRMSDFLETHPSLTDTFVRHLNNPVIDLWNKSDIPEFAAVKKTLDDYRCALMIPQIDAACSEYAEYLSKQIPASPSPQVNVNIELAKEKLLLVKYAQQQLTGNNSDREKVELCIAVLKKNRDLLATRRDSGFMTFVKALGVIAASIFTVGIASYPTYQRLFGKQATRGKVLMSECEKLVGLTSPKISPLR